MGLFSRIRSGIDAHNAKLKAREDQRIADLMRRAEESERRREAEAERQQQAALQRLKDLCVTFTDPSNQLSIDVSAFFALYDKPHRLKAPYVDRFAGQHSGVQMHSNTAMVGSIIGASATAYRRSSLEFGMENFELARYVYDLSAQEIAMLKITNFLHGLGEISDAHFNSVSCAVLFNRGDCILRPAKNQKTGAPVKATNIQEMACRACLQDNVLSAKAAFDPVFQVAMRTWKKIMADGEPSEISEFLLGEPLSVIMS
jgi:hypothetical protein